MSQSQHLAAFGRLPGWIEKSLRHAFQAHLGRRSPTDEELRFELHIDSRELDSLRINFRLLGERSVRPTALGLAQLREAEPMLEVLDRLVRLGHDRYHPNAAPILAPELLDLLGLDAERADRILPFATDLDVGLEGPPWRLVLSETWARHATLESALHERYPAQYQANAHLRLAETPPSAIGVRLRRLRTTGFRALRSLDLPLASNLTVLVGPNRVGKSTVLDAIAFVAQALDQGLHPTVDAYGGLARLRTKGTTSRVEIEIGFEAAFGSQKRVGRYLFDVDTLGAGIVTNLETLELGSDMLLEGHRSLALVPRQDGTIAEIFHAADTLALPKLPSAETFPPQAGLRDALTSVFFADADLRWGQDTIAVLVAAAARPRRVVGVQDIFMRLARDPAALTRTNEILHELVPGMLGLESVVDANLSAGSVTARLEAREDGLRGTIPIEDLSAGTRQMLILAALYVSDPAPQAILLEEADAAIHPGALPAFRDLLRSLAGKATIVATTHSPAFVSLLDAETEVIALERDGEEIRALPLADALRSRKWLASFGTTGEAYFRAASERPR